MEYSEALDYIHNTLKFGIKLGLHNISRLLELMGNPHKKLKYVHVAGTNGKGSTVAFISNVLTEAGYTVGMYTSPYIERFTERIRINNEEIPETDVARLTEYVKEKISLMVQNGEHHPTEFEIVTAIAFQYFYEKGCDIVVLEVGLGGRFDSTNVIEMPLAAVITTISFDHMDKLGNTLGEIAFEKAGIIKEGCEVVLYPQKEEAEKVILEVAEEKRARVHRVNFDDLKDVSHDSEEQTFDYLNHSSMKISLLGRHQVYNAATALLTINVLRENGIKISDVAINRGFLNARWSGRFEVLHRKPVFIIDGAHNTEGAETLARNLKDYFPDKRIILIVGVLRDKDYKSFVSALLTVSEDFITITPNSGRALSAEELAIFINHYCKNVQVSDTIEDAIRTSFEIASKDDVICAFGSLYYIGEVRKYILKEKDKVIERFSV